MCSCAETRKRLNAYIDGELPNRKRKPVEKHLAECVSCRAVLEGLRGLEPFLQDFDVPPVPAVLTSRILSEALLRQKRAARSPIRLWRRAFFATGVPIAALLAGVVMGAYMGWTSYRSSGLEHKNMAITVEKESVGSSLYAFDVLSTEPLDSLEAATLAFLENGK
jgi:predicted anti-sigma-YlaC factor YlaD